MKNIIRLNNYNKIGTGKLLPWLYPRLTIGHNFLVPGFNNSKIHWQKRGLILLLNHPKVIFTQLPDESTSESKEPLTKSELLDCLNPAVSFP